MATDRCDELAALLAKGRPKFGQVFKSASSVEDFADEYVRLTLERSEVELRVDFQVKYHNGIYAVEICPYRLMEGNNDRARNSVIRTVRGNGGAGTIFFYPQNTVRDFDKRKINEKLESAREKFVAGFVEMAYNPKNLEERIRKKSMPRPWERDYTT